MNVPISNVPMSRFSMPSAKMGFIVITALALCLYLPFLSRNYDPNGLYEAMSVETGETLFNPNHTLYAPIGFVLYQASRWMGHVGLAAPMLEVLSALCGAFGVGFAYIAFLRLSQNHLSAAAAALWWGTTWAYWYFSTDVAYVMLASMLTAAGLAALLGTRDLRAAISAGVLVALAILAWEASIFLFPSFCLGIFLIRKPATKKSGFQQLGIFLASSFLVLGIAYLVIGLYAFHLRSIQQWMGWLTTHNNSLLPMYGHFGWDRVFAARHSFIESLIPLNPRLGLGDYRGWPMQPGPAALYVSSWTLLFLTGLLLTLVACRFFQRGTGPGLLPFLWLLLSFASFLPFNLWWDAYESRWFIVPNLFLAGTIAVALSYRPKAWLALPLFLCIAAIGVANYSSTIRPRRFRLLPARKLAACVGKNMKPSDLFLASDWEFHLYLYYLHDRRFVSLIEAAANTVQPKGWALQFVKSEIARTQRAGGRVYATDYSSYEDWFIPWLTGQTGFTVKELNQFQGAPAFSCGPTQFQFVPDELQ